MREPPITKRLRTTTAQLRIFWKLVVSLLPTSAVQQRGTVTRDEIAALFAADLSRGQDRRR